MAVTQYRAVRWSPNELIGEDKMNQMSTNMDWIAQNTPRALYTIDGLKTQQGIKIAAGMAFFQGSTTKDGSESESVIFGDFFSPNCMPIITTGSVSIYMRSFFVGLHGLNGLKPDARGFIINARRPSGKPFPRSFYVAWQALGY